MLRTMGCRRRRKGAVRICTGERPSWAGEVEWAGIGGGRELLVGEVIGEVGDWGGRGCGCC